MLILVLVGCGGHADSVAVCALTDRQASFFVTDGLCKDRVEGPLLPLACTSYQTAFYPRLSNTEGTAIRGWLRAAIDQEVTFSYDIEEMLEDRCALALSVPLSEYPSNMDLLATPAGYALAWADSRGLWLKLQDSVTPRIIRTDVGFQATIRLLLGVDNSLLIFYGAMDGLHLGRVDAASDMDIRFGATTMGDIAWSATKIAVVWQGTDLTEITPPGWSIVDRAALKIDAAGELPDRAAGPQVAFDGEQFSLVWWKKPVPEPFSSVLTATLSHSGSLSPASWLANGFWPRVSFNGSGAGLVAFEPLELQDGHCLSQLIVASFDGTALSQQISVGTSAGWTSLWDNRIVAIGDGFGLALTGIVYHASDAAVQEVCHTVHFASINPSGTLLHDEYFPL